MPEALTGELDSVHSKSFTQILEALGISLAISTYQAGKVILARADGDKTNTHFRNVQKPMGMAVKEDRITLGVEGKILDLRNTPQATTRLATNRQHDALFLPRQALYTGDIDIHEMAWLGEELLFINTRFSCICRFNPSVSFEPVWTPPFISAYDIRDRCHLNGLGVRDGQLKYVTSLSTSDEPEGWRKQKAAGGIIMDVETNQCLLDGLSMPHSPRWHQGAVWFLESGKGTLSRLKQGSKEAEVIAVLPGFTRGLDILGDYAFVGVSQVRGTAAFSGVDVTRNLQVRDCGVWVVDLNSFNIVALLKFTSDIQEIFSVCIVPHRFPEFIVEENELSRQSYVVSDSTSKRLATPDTNWQTASHHFEAGNAHYHEKDFNSATECYREALALDPTHLPARFNLGLTLFDLEQFAQARTQLEMVIAEDASMFDAFNSLGCICMQTGDTAAAAEYFRKGLEIRPNSDALIKNLAALENS